MTGSRNSAARASARIHRSTSVHRPIRERGRRLALAAFVWAPILALASSAAAAAASADIELAQSSNAPIQLVPLAPPQLNPSSSSQSQAPSAQTPSAQTPSTTTQPNQNPPILSPQPGNPVSTSPSQPAPGFGSTPGTAASAMPTPGIQVNTLGAPDAESIGVLDPSQGGLGLDLWQGSQRALVLSLIQALPAAIPSAALRDLQHRLLLSTASPPAGAADGGPGLLAARAAKLLDSGDFDGLKALGAVVPANASSETMTRLEVETALIDGKTAAACPEVAVAIKQYPTAYWQKVQVFCQLLAKKPQLAEMGLGLLRDQGDDKDTAYYTLTGILLGDRNAKLTSLADATPLHLAMMRAAKRPLPEDVLRSSSPMVLRAVALSRDEPVELRLAAAERATELGALTPDALREIYDAVPVSPDELKTALTKAQAQYGPRARVLLYRAAKAQRVPAARAEALRAALELARSAGVFDLAVAVNLPLIEGLEPAPELGFIALDEARALFSAGETDKAMTWLASARVDSATNSDSQAVVTGLWPYTLLAASAAGAWDQAGFDAWYAAEKASKDPADAHAADERAVRLLGLLSALGTPVPADAWQVHLADADGEPAAMPSMARWQALKDATAAGHRGETVCLVLLAVGNAGAANANPMALDAAVDALHRIGLDPDARRLAIEAALVAGI